MNTFLIFLQASATIIIAVYAVSNYKLSKTIQKENAKIFVHFITANLFKPSRLNLKENFLHFRELLQMYNDFLKENP